MAPPRRIDPLNPVGSIGPRRLGQGVPGGIQRLSPSLINPLNPASSFNAAKRAKQSPQDRTWERLNRIERPLVRKLVGEKRVELISSNWDPDKAKLTVKEIADLRKMGVDKDMIPLLQDVVEGKRQLAGGGSSRHRSMLTTASRVLGVLEAAPAGFFSATEKYQREHGYKGRALDYVSHPSRIYKELGAGFSEVPTAVREGKTYAELLRETTDKNSITHKWAMPIGLGMSIFFDPTTYLTFGATSASKTAAYHLLAQADKAAHVAASEKVVANFGKNIKLAHGEVVRANWKNYDEIVNDVKLGSGSPFTLGDALENLKHAGLNQKDQIRRTKELMDPKTGVTAKATIRQRVGAQLAPNNVMGGRGMRFMGKELPGSVALGSKISGVSRAGVGQTKIAETLGEALIPDFAARHVIADSQRASALVEMSRYKSEVQKLQSDIGRNVREMQRPVLDAADELDPEELLHSIAPGTTKAFSGVQPKGVLVKPEARRGLMTAADDVLDPAQKVLRTNIKAAVDEQIEAAVKVGLPRQTIAKLWDDLAVHYDDPLRALAEFKFKASARTLGKQFAKQILDDRRFALPMKPILTEAAQAKRLKKAAEAGKPVEEFGKDFLDEVPTGYVEFRQGNQRWAVTDAVIEGLRDVTNPVRLDGSLQRGFKNLNMIQDWWKLYATSPNPAFHVMNFIGATWNNALAQVYNPMDYFDGMEYVYRARKEEAATRGAKFGVTRRVPQSTPEGKQAVEMMSEAEARSGLGRSSFLFGDVTKGHFSPTQLAMSETPMDKTNPLFEEFGMQALESGKGLAARQLLPEGGFREPDVIHTQVVQAQTHTQIPAPVTLTHPAMIPDTAADLTPAQRDTVGAVIARHTHAHGNALAPTVENMAYVNQLKGAIDPSISDVSLDQLIGELKVGKSEGLYPGVPKPKNWDEFHDNVIADLERLAKEQKVQYVKPSFPDAPFKTPGELAMDAAGQDYPPIYRPTPEQLETEPWNRTFPVLVDKSDPSKIYIGSPQDTHEDVLFRWQIKGHDQPGVFDRYTQGTGVFNDDGSIAKVNIFKEGELPPAEHWGGDVAWDDPSRLMHTPEAKELQRTTLDKANEVYARASDKRVARRAPSIQDLAGDKPYLSYFRVYQDPANPDRVIAGAPGDDHYEIVDELGLNPEEVKDWFQGTGVFDPDTGKIANVSIVRLGNDDWEKPAFIPEDTHGLSERALDAARELYGETGAKTVSQIVPEELVVTTKKGKLRTKAIARQYGVTIPRKVAGVGLLATGNPIGFLAFMPELARGGRRLSGTIEDVVRLAPFLKYSNNPQIAAVLREYGPINAAMKVDYEGFTKADQQVMYDIGANISRQFQFDYSNLTPFERYVAKSIFPFWTYYKNNLALQVQQIAKNPKLFGVALKTMNYINDNGENYSMGPWEEILPPYFENLMAFQVPVPNGVRKQLGLPEDMPLFLNPKMPFLSINLVPNVWDVLRDPSQTTPQKLRELAAPVAGAWGPFAPLPLGPGSKILLEAGTGYNLGLNRPIDWRRVESGDTQQAYTEAPPFMKYLPDQLNKYFGVFNDPKTGKVMMSQTGKYIVEQMTTPFINNLGSAIPLQQGTEEDVARQRADLVSWLTGARLIPVDVLRLNRNSAYTLLNALEAKQDRYETMGRIMPEKDLELLALIRADLKGIEATWDMRELEAEEAKNAP